MRVTEKGAGSVLGLSGFFICMPLLRGLCGQMWPHCRGDSGKCSGGREEPWRTDPKSSRGQVENLILRVGETFSGELAKARHEGLL